ncbi:Holliday junction branch migration protein RuvA [Eubacterium oxidoreducens]|uniref:Holliday junction branch migration complex subunit RuvA n=1 Tax=Eubacterium oxidoreducens TaxID=1732 RepID=A0A1G6AMV7_EUBOX|nr:Holliday junction branch migration protein RuvA [Eubacterium oxidoreducens]SDB09697.1 Holliday junction DNA helicase subunit RuvA [Eubacterium oxidoreducens]
MYSYFIGTIADIESDRIIIETNNIGYEIFLAEREIEELGVVGDEVKVFTYLYVREDALILYGFCSKESFKMFKLLISVNGIGPKAALAILSILTPYDLQFAILSEDAKTISKAQGVGTKSAQRAIMELKDKISLEEAFEEKSNAHSAQSENNSAKAQAIAALESLGFSKSQALKAINSLGDISGYDIEMIIKLALKEL